MMSRSSWYLRVVVIWTVVVIIGILVSYGIHQLPLPTLLLVAIDAGVWVGIGSSLAGPWSYDRYTRNHQVLDRLHRRSGHARQKS